MENEKRAAQKAAWDKENTVKAAVKLNRRTDAGIIDMLAKTNNKQGLIKQALREYRESHDDFQI